MSKVNLLIAENFASADHNEERRESAERCLHDRADERMAEEVVVGVHLDLFLHLDRLAVNNDSQVRAGRIGNVA